MNKDKNSVKEDAYPVKYVVTFRGRLINRTKSVMACDFQVNILTNTVVFRDVKGDNVALFRWSDIKGINKVDSFNIRKK